LRSNVAQVKTYGEREFVARRLGISHLKPREGLDLAVAEGAELTTKVETVA